MAGKILFRRSSTGLFGEGGGPGRQLVGIVCHGGSIARRRATIQARDGDFFARFAREASMGEGVRQHGGDAYRGLKTATRTLVKAAGGLEAAEGLTRGDHSTIGRWASPNNPGAYAPIDVIADLEAATGLPVVTRTLASLSGHVLVALPQPGQPATWHGALARVTVEAGDVIARLARSLDGGAGPDRSARAELAREIDEAQAALADLAGRLRQEDGQCG